MHSSSNLTIYCLQYAAPLWKRQWTDFDIRMDDFHYMHTALPHRMYRFCFIVLSVQKPSIDYINFVHYNGPAHERNGGYRCRAIHK